MGAEPAADALKIEKTGPRPIRLPTIAEAHAALIKAAERSESAEIIALLTRRLDSAIHREEIQELARQTEIETMEAAAAAVPGLPGAPPPQNDGGPRPPPAADGGPLAEGPAPPKSGLREGVASLLMLSPILIALAFLQLPGKAR